MSRKHSTLLKEEIDEEEEGSGSGGDKKKREKEKDGVEKKKKYHKKGGAERSEGYYNDSMMKSAKPTTTAISTAAVNPSAEMVTSPIHSQSSAVIPPPLQPPPQSHQSHRHHVVQQNYTIASQMPPTTQGYAIQGVQGQAGVQQMSGVQLMHGHQVVAGHWQQQATHQRLLPPPGAQHIQMVQQPFQQMQSPQPSHPQAQFAPQGQHPAQQVQYHPHSTQQGYYTVVQYPHGVTPTNQIPGQVVGYQGHPMVHPGMVHAQPVAVAPQSPTSQGQMQQESAWPQHAEGNWAGHPPATADPNWHPGMVAAQDQQRDGNWAAFDGSPPTESKAHIPVANRKEITWRESPDNSSSDEEIERSSSPELAGEEGEGLLRAPSLTSFAESTSSIEEEGEENPWKIQPEQQDYYTKQFKRLQPVDGGVIKGPKARDFFLKSSLPKETLSKIWHLSDINKDNALDLDEFCIAMHLVVAIRHGLELPTVLPDVLLYHKCQANDHLSGDRGSPLQENVGHENVDTVHEVSKPWARFRPSSYSDRLKLLNHISFDHSASKPVTFRESKEDPSDVRPRSLSDPSINEDHPLHLSRKTSMPSSSSNITKPTTDGAISPGPTVSIERPRAAKISLLDAQPGQLLPPPSGKFTGWTPTKAERKDSYSGESDDDSDEDDEEESRPMSPGQAMPVAIPMPPVPEDSSASESPPTPPATPQPGSPVPQPVLPDAEQVTRRLSKRSERPRSAGDLNEVKPLSQNDSGTGSTPTNISIGSDGKKEPPPPPPPRNKKGHSRSSSLDLNKLFASKGKESRANTIGSPTSSLSSQNSQNSDVTISSKTEPKKEEENEEIKKSKEDVTKEENFADFSNFETLVKAQEGADNQMSVPTQGRSHRRSLSLDQGQDYLPKTSKPITNEVVARVNNGPSKVQEALPRPVPKLKPPGSPPVKLLKLHDRTSKKEGSEERKLKTEPPKVIVKPLTKKGKLQNSIRDLKDKNLLLSRLNSELQQEHKEAMEQRITLEHKLERLKPFKSK